MRRAAFIDRDGVINEDRHYVHRIADFRLLPGAVAGLRRLQDAGFLLVVVTNQGGIALGRFGEADFERLTAHMRAELAAHGVALAGVYHCPHHPDSADAAMRGPCECRKPRPGLLRQAARELGIDLGASVLVGDKASDIAAGRAAGVPRNYLVRSGQPLPDGPAAASGVYDDLAACAAAITGP